MQQHVFDLILMEDQGLIFNVDEALSAAVYHYLVELLETFEQGHHSNENSPSVVMSLADR